MAPRARVLMGTLLVALGLLTGLVVLLHPEGLRAPLWVALAACGCFVLAGIAVALQAWMPGRLYSGFMVAVMALMMAIPLWIALGPGRRSCASSLPILPSEVGCRAAFGVSAMLIALMVGVSGLRLLRRPAPP
jgi:hypothetical protein